MPTLKRIKLVWLEGSQTAEGKTAGWKPDRTTNLGLKVNRKIMPAVLKKPYRIRSCHWAMMLSRWPFHKNPRHCLKVVGDVAPSVVV